MTQNDVDFFERIKAQLAQLHNEVTALSKSKPDNPINTFKLSFINEKLKEANEILSGKFKPFSSFTVFDSSALPTNSDVVVIVSQYLDCLEAWRCANIHNMPMEGYRWRTTDKTVIRTEAPSRFRIIS